MRIDGFFWLDDVVDKVISKHNVFPSEVEDVYYALGRTDAGRYLIVYFIYKLDHRALVVSARGMDLKERRDYERK